MPIIDTLLSPGKLRRLSLAFLGFLLIGLFLSGPARSQSSTGSDSSKPRVISGIYPHLAMFNDEGECGTGAVVPWANRLWVVTYGPHLPKGSSDKLYEIDDSLHVQVRPESIGGTPANRMIHRESQQLFIGPYAIDAQAKVRVIPYTKMYGRHTGTARHLFDPEHQVYFGTMEEGIYEVDVRDLSHRELWTDEQLPAGKHSDLPGYHGKGLYTAQGRLLYANNGEHGKEALSNPETPSGVLASWDGKQSSWDIVQRNQFTEITGPGGLYGNANPSAPAWSIGWDHRSLILMCLDQGRWHRYRLPKASHTYDGAHGWNTEWPRIRDIGEDDWMMTMHGMFWRFPKTFRASNTGGIRPRSSYLKVVGDFCKWNDHVVLGCDDTAKSEFLNKRRAKGEIAAPQSQSNLWFVPSNQLDHLGPVIARGALYIQDSVKASVTSDPFLVEGYTHVGLTLEHANDGPITWTLESDATGTGEWHPIETCTVASKKRYWKSIDLPKLSWIRLKADRDVEKATAVLYLHREDELKRKEEGQDPLATFDGIAKHDEKNMTGGIVRALGSNRRTLQFVSHSTASPQSTPNLYELDASLTLKRVDSKESLDYQQTHAAIPKNTSTFLQEEDASILYIDDRGRRYRLPRASRDWNAEHPLGPNRICREVATERDLFQAGGIFYELPAENAGGFAKVRAVATHNRRIVDFCSYRGLLVISGVRHDARNSPSPHIITSEDQQTALWVGAIDDVWKLGKPYGFGGPWKNTAVQAQQPSDPFLLSGFLHKTLELAHQSSNTVKMTLQYDALGTGAWGDFETYSIEPGKAQSIQLPNSFHPYWIRLYADSSCQATAQFTLH